MLDAMKCYQNPRTEEEESIRRIGVMPNIPGFTPKFNQIARRHRFKVANKTDTRVKDLITNAKTPLGDKNSRLVYMIPCGCEENVCNGETNRKWGSRKKEHCDKVRLTKEDVEAGNETRATEKIKKR